MQLYTTQELREMLDGIASLAFSGPVIEQMQVLLPARGVPQDDLGQLHRNKTSEGLTNCISFTATQAASQLLSTCSQSLCSVDKIAVKP